MRPTADADVVTVAAVRETEKGAEVRFNERQQPFAVPARRRAATLELLTEALKRRRPLRIEVNPHRATLVSVEPSSDEDARRFARERPLLEDPARPVRIDVESLDPTTFNIVDHHLSFPAFALCSRVVPSYRVAKSIFDFCAAQGCELPGPYAITPCIPFQFVIDGCHARAHKMRRIIEDRFGYCCEKVFSFANQGDDTLAVRATKWGGCCVYWWFHVAPLVRVRVRLQLGPFSFQLVLALVIDPGMFDKPVLLSTWLGAQQQLACAGNAHVSMYSIQLSTAYTPANHAGTAFTTDPTYSATDATLIAYANLTTC
ncbi:MAG TPA: protein-glutamine glutaminase family protein [Gaiellaceae bacterium]